MPSTTVRARVLGGLVAAAALATPLAASPALAAAPAPAQAAASSVCLANVHSISLYVPASISGLTQAQRNLLAQADFYPDRGWKVAELSLRQELRPNAARTAVQSVTAYPSLFTTKTGGALGVSATLLTKENGGTGAASTRSQASFNVTVKTPFGAWNPGANYQIAILANVNGYFDYSPMSDKPAEGIYVQPAALDC